MKKFKVTVNGQAYEVEVEEIGTAAVSVPVVSHPAPTPVVAAPIQAPTQTPIPEPVKSAPISEGAVAVKAPMPGKITAIKAQEGQTVKKGEVLLVLEAMKMQNDIMASTDGTVTDIRVAEGDNVKTGEILAVLS